jgi:hypothetical protein
MNYTLETARANREQHKRLREGNTHITATKSKTFAGRLLVMPEGKPATGWIKPAITARPMRHASIQPDDLMADYAGWIVVAAVASTLLVGASAAGITFDMAVSAVWRLI